MAKTSILKNKFYLYLTEFFAGVSVMAVELGASRLLAPYFSSSQVVWTIIIGTIMIAMALGNLYGGRSADKNPDPAVLYHRILVAAVWTAAIPFAGRYVILGISALLVFAVNSNLLVIAAFCSCIALFVYPLFLLGTVTPSLVKYTVDSLEDSGRTVGRLGACNTIGSILGTFLPTFVTIPAAGTSVTFLIFAGVLLVIALAYFISEGGGKKVCAVSAALFALCAVFGHNSGFAFWESDLTYEGESVYNYLQVKETDSRVILSTNVLFGVQSVHMKNPGLTGMYYDYALAAPVMADIAGKDDAKILILGNGTGTYATQCTAYFPNASVEGVEIDEKITELAKEYFALPEAVSVVTYDGRAFLQASKEKYDVIQVDAYQDITIPFQMSSVEFFTLVREHLTPNGVMVVNMNMRSDGEDGINQALADTISAVFDEVYVVNVRGTTNRELFAAQHSGEGGLVERLAANAPALSDAALVSMMNTVKSGLTVYIPGDSVLTDDKAPVEVLGMRVIDVIIQDETAYYKELYREKGLPGVMAELGL